jgi:uncharacterized glyoxalase superfamily protein PhnB
LILPVVLAPPAELSGIMLTMAVPQALSFVTLGARSVPALRAFYAAWGWPEREGSDDSFVSYQLGSVRLALFPVDALTAEAAPGCPPPGEWSGVTLAVNVDSAAAVDDAFGSAVQAGAQVVAEPVVREWGGYSGYVADPEGTRWEIAYLPGFPASRG